MTSTISFEFRRTGPREFPWEVSFTTDRPHCSFEVTLGLAGRALFFQAGNNQRSVKGAGVWRNEDGLNLDAPGGYLSPMAWAKVSWRKEDGTTASEQALARGILYLTQGQTLVTASDTANLEHHS
jgi:hypothetical protein